MTRLSTFYKYQISASLLRIKDGKHDLRFQNHWFTNNSIFRPNKFNWKILFLSIGWWKPASTWFLSWSHISFWASKTTVKSELLFTLSLFSFFKDLHVLFTGLVDPHFSRLVYSVAFRSVHLQSNNCFGGNVDLAYIYI